MSDPTKPGFKWCKPEEAMTLHLLKKKRKALQARISTPNSSKPKNENTAGCSQKRKNPFIRNDSSKKVKIDDEEESQDALYNLYQFANGSNKENLVEKLIKEDEVGKSQECVEIVKATGEKKLPVDWALKTKMRLMSLKPFNFNQNLKTSEEASGTTSFVRCFDIDSSSGNCLDTSFNSKFHQCCLYWQHPYFPWQELFPRNVKMNNCGTSLNLNVNTVKQKLHTAWSDSFRNLFQLLRTRQCPFFYICANSYTVLFRSSGIGASSDINAMITPTTRGFRHVLRQEEIEFTMPLKENRKSNDEDKIDNEEEEETPQEHWLKSMGIQDEDIRQINYTEEKIQQKIESEIDNSEQSLVYIEGVEVQALYNFLINCKSVICLTGAYAGIPPTILAPVAFHGATLNALKVRQTKVHNDNENFYSLELSGPILPHTVHNLFSINPVDHSVTATFANLTNTMPFSQLSGEKIAKETENAGTVAFGKAALSDCGLSKNLIDRFCCGDIKSVANVECIKYSAEDCFYSWT